MAEGVLIPERDYDPDEGEGPVLLSWQDVHRNFHHDRPAPDYYTPRMKAIWNAKERWSADCPFCDPGRRDG